MATGKVIWFNEFKGYGFIEDEKGNRYLAQATSFKSEKKKKLKEGQEVKFTAKKDISTPLSSGTSGIAQGIEIL